MKKTISIRFVNKFGTFYIQKRSLLGWKYIEFYQMIMEHKIYHYYYDTDKENLLNRVVKEHYGIDRDCVIIKEYPLIKYYN